LFSTWRDWTQWTKSVDFIEEKTGLDLFSNLSDTVQRAIESNRYIASPLLADSVQPKLNTSNDSSALVGFVNSIPLWTNSLAEESPFVLEASLGTKQISRSQVGIGQVSTTQVSTTQVSTTQVGTTQVGTHQSGLAQLDIGQFTPSQQSLAKVNSDQIQALQIFLDQISCAKISNPFSILTDQSFYIHDKYPFPAIKGDELIVFSQLHPYLTPLNSFNFNIEIADLPTGQLAEANITGFDPTGRPNSGTLYLDTDANGLGWYIDPTPWDNSEFSQTLTDTAYRATSDSAAYGHYDLLTTLLHETAHLQGFIAGYSNYDNRIQTQNGNKVFNGDTFSAILTPDGSHLNSSVYTYDLMNTTLTPGVRKLPSALDIQILNTLRTPQPINSTATTSLTAPLSAGALIAINNGSFDTNTDWYTRGDSHILNGQAILSEDSPYLSHLSQTFVIPQGAKALQFTLVNTDLKTNNTALAPNDAFEIALLNHNTNTSVLPTLSGLSNTDALLNIQTNGQTYFSNAITLVGATTSGTTLDLKNPRTVQIDVSTLTPGTVVTLYFDLLGFGAQASTITIDDVQILSEQSQAPVANNDSATLNQNTPTTLNILENENDPDGTLNPSTLVIAQAPQHGKLSINTNGTITYQPTNNYIGTNQFTYLIQDNSGVYSNPAIVNLTILNPIPTINQVTIDSTLTEGTPAQLSASATISGNQPLTYTWTLGDGTTTTGQTIQHTYKDNGTYTVTDKDGGSTTDTLVVTVANVAPTITNLTGPIPLNEGQSATYIYQKCDRSHSPKSSAPVKSNNASPKDSS
jgi:hypothetical protein